MTKRVQASNAFARIVLLVARNEARSLLRDGRLVVSLLVVTLLLLAVIGWGEARVRQEQAERSAAQSRARARWDAHDRLNPHAAAHYGIWVFKPVTPLATLDPGLDPYGGVAAHLVAHRSQAPMGASIENRDRYGRWAEPTAAAVVTLLLPLVLLLAGGGTLIDERVQGTMRQVMAAGVPRPAFALGKALGVGGTFLALLTPAALLGGVLALRAASPADRAATALLIVLWAAAALAYLATFVGLTLAVSAVAPSRSAAYVVLVTVYAVNGFIAPRLFVEYARQNAPAPTVAELQEQAEREISQQVPDVRAYHARRNRLIRELLQRYNVKREQDLPVNPEGFALQQTEEQNNQIRDRVFGVRNRALDRQDAYTAQVGGLLSPACAFSAISSALAQTDGVAQRRFLHAIEEYRREWVRRLNNDLAQNSRPGKSYTAPASLFRDTPEFRYPQPPIGATLQRCAGNILLLGAWVVLVFAAAMAASTREVSSDL